MSKSSDTINRQEARESARTRYNMQNSIILSPLPLHFAFCTRCSRTLIRPRCCTFPSSDVVSYEAKKYAGAARYNRQSKVCVCVWSHTRYITGRRGSSRCSPVTSHQIHPVWQHNALDTITTFLWSLTGHMSAYAKQYTACCITNGGNCGSYMYSRDKQAG